MISIKVMALQPRGFFFGGHGMIDTDERDFNEWVCVNYYRQAVLIAFRFTDLGVKNWEPLACQWHQQFGYGVKAPKDDVYFVGNMQRRKSVDELVANPRMTPAAEIMLNAWLFEKAQIAKRRGAPPVVITPPPPEPPPKPTPLPPKEEPKPEPRKNPNPNVVTFSVWFGIIASVAGAVAWFVPAIKPFVAVLVPVIKSILSMLGV